jgi:hypothetical protein
MDFATFAELDPGAVRALVQPRVSGVAMPFNGTRRWFLATHGANTELYGQAYAHDSRVQMWSIIELLFDDGVRAVYTPVVGRALAERGPAYMAFVCAAVGQLADSTALERYARRQIAVSFYGETALLPPEVRDQIAEATRITHQRTPKHHIRYGVFADRPLPDFIARTVALSQQLNATPTVAQLLEAYYGGEGIPAELWIGSDQPSVFDVPFVVNEQSALYFLQFPTFFLDRATWRRILYDYLYVRGDEETLYSENISSERYITGLGIKHDGFWKPAIT